MVNIKSNREIELIKQACKIASIVQKELEKNIKPGISTLELDKIAEDVIKSYDAIPAQKNYPSYEERIMPFPATICASINDEVIHGIPSKDRYLQNGDIVSIDLVVKKNGFHGDCARTYIVGNIDNKTKKLLEVTKQAFFEGIKYATAQNRLGDISNAIGEYVAKNGFAVIKEFQGHGIGREMHEEPGIPNYGKKGKGIRLQPGMTLAIEPMVVAGRADILQLEDGWTIITSDGSNSAHYENTILITEKEPIILTR